MSEEQPFTPYPPIERHGVIGDRRTAALVAADGTISWLCLPNYDGPPVFGALLDAERGGGWRFGPATPTLGRQQYADGSAALITTWTTDDWTLELTDLMAWPEDQRAPGGEHRRVIVRRLRCLSTRESTAAVPGALWIAPRHDWSTPAEVAPVPGGLRLRLGAHTLGLWASFPLTAAADHATATIALRAGEERWAVLAYDEAPADWTAARAQYSFAATIGYWQEWQRTLTYTGPRAAQVRRSALLVHLLSYAPTGSLVAAPTTSLPERIGGDRNYDYRYAWVRDASMSLAIVSLLGDTYAGQRYLDQLAALGSTTDAPFQVVYRVDGGTDLPEQLRDDVTGYRGSRPIRIGNRACRQRQHDSLAFLAECALVYLEHGGVWRDAYWEMLRRAADYTVDHWQLPDSGIWELPHEAHYVSSKVMSWVILKRTVQIAAALGRLDETERWQATMDRIMAEVLDRGWSERLGAFRQCYERDTLDAAALLIPVMGFLAADHPRVVATVQQIEARLRIDGFVHRFLPPDDRAALGEFEGAFLPCTFWLATTYAKQGRTAEAEALLAQAEAIAGELGIFAEEVDARQRTFLGNYPLLWAQMEYVQAIVELAKARPVDAARYLVGAAKIQLGRLAGDLTQRRKDAQAERGNEGDVS